MINFKKVCKYRKYEYNRAVTPTVVMFYICICVGDTKKKSTLKLCQFNVLLKIIENVNLHVTRAKICNVAKVW